MTLENIVSKYALEEILKTNNEALALADKNKKIVWYNKKFKQTSGLKRLKGKEIFYLFEELNDDSFYNLKKTKTFEIPLINSNNKIIISALKEKENLDGFLLKFEPYETISETHWNLLFQKEFQNILTILAKEKSLQKLSETILESCLKISKGIFGIIVFHNKSFEFLISDEQNYLENHQEVKKEISANYSFIVKWLGINKRTLLALNQSSNIGFNLTKILKTDILIISPCFFDNDLIASIIVGEKENKFQPHTANRIEQFAALLSFAISSIRTRELNTALENRLLQSQKLETIGKLTSGMAHDFSNLLSSIFGSLNLLKKRIPNNESVYKLIDNIENCSIRARDLTKGLLSYGKPTPKRKEIIKPNLLLSEIARVIEQTFPKNIKFVKEVEENLYEILGNGTEIYQIMLNLSVNAKEAIEKGGTITLTAKNIIIDKSNMINYPLLDEGKYVWFSVKDTGSGIDEENLQKIFDPYFSTKQKETGSGLGLYVSYGIIKAHKGHILVSSILNEGTTFDVYLPSYEPAKSNKDTSAEKIILLADDELMLRDLLAELLESNDYNVIKVASGKETLKVLTEEIKVDLIIMDYSMPEMNGLECTEKIRKLNFDVPIILSTGSLSIEENFDPKKMKIDRLLAKPYEFDTMLSTIQELI